MISNEAARSIKASCPPVDSSVALWQCFRFLSLLSRNILRLSIDSPLALFGLKRRKFRRACLRSQTLQLGIKLSFRGEVYNSLKPCCYKLNRVYLQNLIPAHRHSPPAPNTPHIAPQCHSISTQINAQSSSGSPQNADHAGPINPYPGRPPPERKFWNAVNVINLIQM